MKNIKKLWLLIIPVVIAVVVTIIVFLPSKVKGEDNVDMATFNSLVNRVEALEKQLQTANDKISELTNTDKNINQDIDSLSGKIDKNTTDITSVKNSYSSNTTRIIKIEAWQIKLYELASRRPEAPATWYQLENFRQSQQ